MSRRGDGPCDRIRAHRPASAPEGSEADFERGLRQFGYALTIAMLMMVVAVLMILVLMGRPPIDTLLFAVALAVGLSPELLPAILTINLSRSAQMMAHAACSCGA